MSRLLTRGDLRRQRETYIAACRSLVRDHRDPVAFWKWCAYALGKAGCKVCGSITEPVEHEAELLCPDCLHARGVHGLRVIPHLEMAARICRRGRGRMRLLLEPRGTYKSTVGVECYVLWRMLHDRNIRVLIASETSKIAEDSLRLLKVHLESDHFQALYGDYTDRKLWAKEAITVSRRTTPLRDPTVQTAGVDHAVTGVHPDLVVIDDIVGGQNCGSEDMRARVTDFLAQLVGLALPHTEYVLFGTRWHLNDTYQLILDRARDLRATVMVRDAEEGNRERFREVRKFLGWSKERIEAPEGDMFFPEVLSPEFLAEQRHAPGVTPAFFSCQYKNKAVTLEDTLGAPAAWLDPRDFPAPLRMVLAVDPAGGERTSSSLTAYWIGGADAKGNIYVAEAMAKDQQPDKIIEEIFLLVRRWTPDMVLFEKNDSLFRLLQREMRLQGFYFPLMPIIAERRKSKEARIRFNVQPVYAAGIVTHSIYLRDRAYENQLLQFGATDRDDIVDAAAMGLAHLRPVRVQKAESPFPLEWDNTTEGLDKLLSRVRLRAKGGADADRRDPLFRRHHVGAN